MTSLARRSGEINQRSGVSVRVSIANYESIISNAYKRALRFGEGKVVPRISDLSAIGPSTMGKIELETMEDGREAKILEDITKRAVLNIFGRYVDMEEMEGIVASFEEGMTIETGSDRPSMEYVSLLGEVEAFDEPTKRLGADNTHGIIASAMEFILEGLHLKRRLNKDMVGGTWSGGFNGDPGTTAERGLRFLTALSQGEELWRKTRYRTCLLSGLGRRATPCATTEFDTDIREYRNDHRRTTFIGGTAHRGAARPDLSAGARADCPATHGRG